MDYPLVQSTQDSTRDSVRVVKVVQKFLTNSWDFDSDFFTELFPITSHTRRIYASLEADLRRGERWKGVPSKGLKSASKLHSPLQMLLGDILRRFGLHEDSRRVLITSNKPLYPHLEFPIHPSLLLAGCGKHFVCTPAPRPLPDYKLAISLFEVYLEDEDESSARDRLAVTMQRLFHHQFNRRYAFGMVIAQKTLTLHLFDRFGALSSPRLDYHAHPVQFCAIIAGLASLDDARLGLDTSIFLGGVPRIRTRGVIENGKKKDIVYKIKNALFYSSDFGGRGTTCFLVYKDARPEQFFVVKDSWVAEGELEGRESEEFLLSHARNQGVVKGITQVLHSEEVQVKFRSGKTVDALFRHRKILQMHNSKRERVHTRIVLTPYGKPLIRFSSRKELLRAYHDAVQAHRELHEVGGILHRDIKPSNILINPHGEEGDRGVLIDLDHAIRLTNKSPYSTKKNIGTRVFMSKNALDGKVTQTYMDDLESFFYVLLYIAISYERPGQPKAHAHPLIHNWRGPGASWEKAGYIVNEFDTEVEPWFGKPFETLLRQLHGVLHEHRVQGILATAERKPITTPDPSQVYEQFLIHIRQALVEISQEAHISTSQGRRNAGDPLLQQEVDDANLDTWNTNPAKDVTRSFPHTAAASRPRRLRANYGITKVSSHAHSHH